MALEASGDVTAQPTGRPFLSLGGIAQDVADFRFEAAAMPPRPSLQARLNVIFEVANHQLRHIRFLSEISRYHLLPPVADVKRGSFSATHCPADLPPNNHARTPCAPL